MQVQEIMTRDPACCGPDTPLSDVARLMVRYAANSIPVVGNPVQRSPLLGLLTDHDIVSRVVAADKDPRVTTAKECMTHPAVVLKLEQDAGESARLMDRERARRVPVVDQNGRLCGIVTQAQITRALQKAYEASSAGH